MATVVFDTVIGKLAVTESEGAVTRLRFESEGLPDSCPHEKSPLLEAAQNELSAYFEGRLNSFTVPLRPEGTAFMLSVWNELCRIPYAQTAAYGEIAKRLDKPGAARAVGMACNKNPIPILIPCHRVIGASGSLTGFGGGLDIKKRLLSIEAGHKG